MRVLGFTVLLVVLAAPPVVAVGSPSGGGNSGGGTSTSKAKMSARDWYDQGWNDSEAGRYSAALIGFEKAAAMKPDYAEAYNMLGFCQRMLGRLDQAFANYEKALKLKPNFPEAREYYGEAWLQRGNVAKAEEQFTILNAAGHPEAAELKEKIDACKASH